MQTRIVTVGNFDGAHRGHAELLSRARRMGDRLGAKVTAVVFDPHPLSVIRPALAPAVLTPFEARAEQLRTLGADEVRKLEPTPGVLGTEPERFIRELRDELGMVGMVEGPDFRFGKGRAGDAAMLRALAPEIGFELDLVETPIEVDLDDQSVVRASSTIVRWLLGHGRVRDAARVLGRPYTLSGEVGRGDRLGRTIGFPTANIRPDSLVPDDGVYACLARLHDGSTYAAAVSIGTRPTFEGVDRRVEAYLLLDRDSDQNASHAPWAPVPGMPEYGWRVSLDFVGRVRDQVRFDGIEPLVGQIERDVDRVRMIVEHHAHADEPISPGAR